MNLSLALLFLVLGLVIGSFLNVVIFRMDDLKSILNSRSHCPNCKQILKWYDLIPFISFILLRAKCRFCGKDISWQYPLVEIGTGILFLLLYLSFGVTFGAIFYLIIFSLLIVVFVYDLKTELTPELFVWIALVLAFLGGSYFGHFGFINMVYGALVGGGVLAILVYGSILFGGAKEKWMGIGDIKLGVILGFLVGFPAAIFGLFLAFLIGSVVGLIYIKVAHKTIKDSLPFAPFLILATFLTLIFGNTIIGWYMGTFIV